MIESEVLLEQVAWTSHTCLEACCQARQILLLQLLTPISLEGLKFESSKSTFDIIHGDSRNSQSFDKMRWPTACCECPAKFVRFLHVLWCCSGSLHIKTTDRIYRSMRAETDGSTLATSSMAKQAAVKPRSTPPMSAGTFTDSRLLQHVCWQHFSQQQKHGNFWRGVVICTLSICEPHLASIPMRPCSNIASTISLFMAPFWSMAWTTETLLEKCNRSKWHFLLSGFLQVELTKISNRIQIFSQCGQKCLENSFRKQLSGDFFRLDVRCQDFLGEAFGRVT